jgi:hypothetical protein
MLAQRERERAVRKEAREGRRGVVNDGYSEEKERAKIAEMKRCGGRCGGKTRFNER